MEIKPTQIKWDQIPEGWMVQPKYDGECNKLIIDRTHNQEAVAVNLQRFEGRSKTEFYPEIIEEATWRASGGRGIPALPDMVVVGEVCVLLDKYRASFPHIQLRMNTQNKAKQKLAMKDKLATFVAFDIEEYKGENLDKEPYRDRYKILEDIFPVLVSSAELDFRIVTVSNTLTNHKSKLLKPQIKYGVSWKEFVKKHEMEGLVVKNPDKPAEQFKLKNWDEDDFKIIGTETTEAGEARGWFISKLTLEDTKGTHVDKGQQFDCKYINYPQTEQAKKDVIGKTAIIKYMKMKGRDGQYLAPRHPSLVEILEFEK